MHFSSSSLFKCVYLSGKMVQTKFMPIYLNDSYLQFYCMPFYDNDNVWEKRLIQFCFKLLDTDENKNSSSKFNFRV